ncbi:hypothetical protein CEXT_812171 [Caerostris extrusa]|uniref:Uncharacterized protein n=1 Tax=Caerostris extrusa TaxID=172846 RepID=A0AAV4TC75_CAEEX|nr:hypothetical protein CEXT_812171 [Caerostris extrusa]
MITHFDAFQFLHAPRIKTQTRRNAMVQTDPHSQNSPNFHPVRRNYFMRTLEQTPTFITRNSSPLKIIVETEQNLPITQTKNTPKTAIESHQKFHQINTKTEEKHPNPNLDSGYPLVKRRDGRFQNTRTQWFAKKDGRS